MSDVTLYTRTTCPGCGLFVKELEKAGVDFEKVNIDLPEYEDARTYVTEVLGAKAVPVVVADNLEPVIGFRPEKLRELIQNLTPNEREV